MYLFSWKEAKEEGKNGTWPLDNEVSSESLSADSSCFCFLILVLEFSFAWNGFGSAFEMLCASLNLWPRYCCSEEIKTKC